MRLFFLYRQLKKERARAEKAEAALFSEKRFIKRIHEALHGKGSTDQGISREAMLSWISTLVHNEKERQTATLEAETMWVVGVDQGSPGRDRAAKVYATLEEDGTVVVERIEIEEPKEECEDAADTLLQEAVQQAIQAERERCLRIVLNHPFHPTTNIGARQNWLVKSIARLIQEGEQSVPKIRFNRKQYMEGECDFHTYYSQFVTPELKESFLQIISKKRLAEAFQRDPHFNSISLSFWDKMAAKLPFEIVQLISASNQSTGGLGVSLSDRVCVLKSAARLIVEEEEKSDDQEEENT